MLFFFFRAFSLSAFNLRHLVEISCRTSVAASLRLARIVTKVKNFPPCTLSCINDYGHTTKLHWKSGVGLAALSHVSDLETAAGL